jgi:tetratricopeptide (TPR) repeat protein
MWTSPKTVQRKFGRPHSHHNTTKETRPEFATTTINTFLTQSFCHDGHFYQCCIEAIFGRAIQLDPSFAYAFTLSGHEYIACDNWDKALQCFRNALRIDPRHYNAWYGLGIVYYRQEKYELAEYHFRRALSINEYNSVLHCYIGMTYHANRKSEAALNALQTALAIDSKNTLAKFKLASVLTTLGQYDVSNISLFDEIQNLSLFIDSSATESSNRTGTVARVFAKRGLGVLSNGNYLSKNGKNS